MSIPSMLSKFGLRRPASQPSAGSTAQAISHPREERADQFTESDDRRRDRGILASVKNFGKSIVSTASGVALLGAGLSLGIGVAGPIVGGAVSMGALLLGRTNLFGRRSALTAVSAWALSLPAILGVGPVVMAGMGAGLGAMGVVGHSLLSMEDKFANPGLRPRR